MPLDMFLKRVLQLPFLWLASPATATTKCTVRDVSVLLPSNASVLFAIPYTSNNNTFGNPIDIAYPTNATNLPPFCAVQINVTSSASSSFTFGLFLPTSWNRRFLAVGNGGFAGGINWLDMGAGLQYGFAVVSTDTGHNSTSFNGTWALNNPESLTDWGYRAMHGSVTLAKDVASEWYGKDIEYSYYSGCSTGGRQGLKEIQISPESFDGVLAGAPAWWTSHLQTWTVEIGRLSLPATKPEYIPVTLFPAIGAEVLRQCDAVDGVLDGVITKPSACDFNYNALLCTPTSNPSACLTATQLDTLYTIYHDYVDVNNTFVFPHLELGSEAQWSVLLGSNSTPNALGIAYVQNFLLNDPTWSWEDYDYSIVQLADTLDPGNATADDFDLSPFQARGGKLIQYHGLADGLIPTGSSPYFYNHVYRTLLPCGISLEPWYRLFLVPGMQHCGGSAVDAPWYFAGPNQAGLLGSGVHSVPGFMDARHDALLALMAWVENGTAPGSIIATKFKNDTVSMGVERQRPLCPYPTFAEYVGGNVNASGSWNCP